MLMQCICLDFHNFAGCSIPAQLDNFDLLCRIGNLDTLSDIVLLHWCILEQIPWLNFLCNCIHVYMHSTSSSIWLGNVCPFPLHFLSYMSEKKSDAAPPSFEPQTSRIQDKRSTTEPSSPLMHEWFKVYHISVMETFACMHPRIQDEHSTTEPSSPLMHEWFKVYHISVIHEEFKSSVVTDTLSALHMSHCKKRNWCVTFILCSLGSPSSSKQKIQFNAIFLPIIVYIP